MLSQMREYMFLAGWTFQQHTFSVSFEFLHNVLKLSMLIFFQLYVYCFRKGETWTGISLFMVLSVKEMFWLSHGLREMTHWDFPSVSSHGQKISQMTQFYILTHFDVFCVGTKYANHVKLSQIVAIRTTFYTITFEINQSIVCIFMISTSYCTFLTRPVCRYWIPLDLGCIGNARKNSIPNQCIDGNGNGN